MNSFTKENCDNLQRTCEQIVALLKENVDGALMLSQKLVLGQKIEDFVNNPIIANSGLLPDKS